MTPAGTKRTRCERVVIAEVAYAIVDIHTTDIPQHAWSLVRQVSVNGPEEVRLALIEDAETTMAAELRSIPLGGDWRVGTRGGWVALAKTSLDELLSLSRVQVKIICPPASTSRHARPPDASRIVPGVLRGHHSWGINARDFLTRRAKLCEQLMELVSTRGFVMLKAPGQSGKTSMLQLLEAAAKAQGLPCKYITLLNYLPPFNFNDILQKEVGLTPKALVRGARRSTPVVLVDEAQVLYYVEKTGSQSLWNSVKLLLEKGRPSSGLRMILACSHGLLPNSSIPWKSGTPKPMPIDIPAELQVHILPREESGGVCSLQLQADEWDELWQSFTSHTKLLLGKAIQMYVYEICAGQVGLVTFCLDQLEEGLKSAELRNPDKIDAHALCTLSSTTFVQRLKGLRSIFPYKGLACKYAEVPVIVRALLWGGSLPDHDNIAMRLLQRFGQVVKCNDSLQFTSPIHYQYFFHALYNGLPYVDKAEDGTVLRLLTCALTRMDAAALRNMESISVDGTLSERLWQLELYRALSTMLQHSVVGPPSFERKYGAKVTVDFLVPGIGVVLEVVRDGCNPNEHLEGFEVPEKYRLFLEKKVVKDWAVVDLRSPVGKRSSKLERRHEKLFTVHFSKSYSKARIHWNGEIVAKEVHLVGQGNAKMKQVMDTLKTYQQP